MACTLLHIVEEPVRDDYEDPNVKDVVGSLPQFLCTQCDPLRKLPPSEALKCLERDVPCWKAPDQVCPD